MHAGSGIVAVSSDAEWRLSHPRCETLRAAAVIFGAFGSDGYFLPSPFKVRRRASRIGPPRDAARHFLPPRLLERTVDAMSYTKLNVLHLHLSDHESFPLRLPGFRR
ncbi:N-acetyl-beta-D-galactosaminidase [Aureococcus anophagefferens]|nr:N-acetyl-beta-D-galactosaminidase [Aureococcus anophagefferens]